MTNTDWTGDTQAVMATLNASNHSMKEREERDYYATPARAVEELLKLESFTDDIWEPACGELHISNILTKHGYSVRSSDIVDRVNNEVLDFLSIPDDYVWTGDIITNPPFSLATEFIQKAVNILHDGHTIAFFLRIQFLEGVKRRKFFEVHPPSRIWVSSRNLRCAKNGDFANATGNASTYAWFVWEKGFNSMPQLGWFNPISENSVAF